MIYHVSLEWLCQDAAILRLHQEPSKVVGDPYIWVVTIVREGDAAIFKGALTAPPLGSPKVINAALKEVGFSKRAHERIKDGQARWITKNL